MRIIHLASELSPYAKVGGMGDVLQGLCGQLAREGHDVEVILPAYPFLKNEDFSHLPYKIKLIELSFFDRPTIYGYPDDSSRFARFTQKACEYIAKQQADVVHAHDWHTALAAALLPNVILTIHNLAYPGQIDPVILNEIGLPIRADYQGQEGCSLLRVGIIHAKKLTTVSPTYAKEILQEPFCEGFHDLLNASQDKLVGILNGIDTTYWDPGADPNLPHHYTADSLEGKERTKRQVLSQLGMTHTKGPVLAAITRLVPQKGPELIEAAIDKTLEKGGAFILLGSMPIDYIKKRFDRFESHPDVYMELKFNEVLSHQVYGAADMVLVPSRYEPCGLTQLIGMRYGALPLVRKTGGLADTVNDFENGFVFEPFEQQAIDTKLDEAIALWQDDRPKWNLLRLSAMKQDYSWKKSATAYADLYSQL